MIDGAAGVILILAGAIPVLLNERYSQRCIESANRYLFQGRLGRRHRLWTHMIGYVVGSGFVVMGLLLLLGVIHLRH